MDEITKRNKLTIGFDLGNDVSQLSYCRANQSVPDTFSLVAGGEEYDIPSVLCRKKATEPSGEIHELWTVGKEALQTVQRGEGVLVEDLILLAQNKTNGIVEETEYTPVKLLEILFRKCLLLVSAGKLEDIAVVVFTLRDVTPELMELIREAVAQLQKGQIQVLFMTRQDCFFQYMIHQPREMWIHDVLLYDYQKSGIKSYYLYWNRSTRPVVGFMEEQNFPQMKMEAGRQLSGPPKEAFFKQLDEAFLEINKAQCENHNITSVFLLGEDFSKDWCKDSLKYLCRAGRVFQGNNLFSKGACYGAREHLLPSSLMQEYLFLAKEKLKANIGIYCNEAGEDKHLQLLYAGSNWYEAHKEMDFILAENNRMSLTITPVNGEKPKVAEITLEGLQVRRNRTTRISFEIHMSDPETVEMEIKDKGFGIFFASTGRTWRESLTIS